LDSTWRERTGGDLFTDADPNLFSNLIRYMSSLGLRKDAHGVAQLSTQDVVYIQQGYPSIIYAQGGLNARLARITMEIQKHLEGADPNGSTIQQRLEYWKTGLDIIKQNPFIGVGIGDIQTAFNTQFELNDSRLHPENRLHTHQQFLTFWIGTGILGLLLFIFYTVATLLIALRYNSYLLLVFWAIITFSYFFEDTLETQVGVTLAAFFVTFILKQEKETKLF
jgi:O-antigen ligase